MHMSSGVIPSMNGVETIIKKPIPSNTLLKEITPYLKMSAIVRAVPGEHIFLLFLKHIKS